MIKLLFSIFASFYLVAHASLVLSAEPRLRILSAQKDIATPAGKDYGLMCEGVSDEVEGMFNNMRWLDPNGEQVQEGTPGVKQYDSNQLKLTFIKPSADQTGQYNCTAVYCNTVTLHASLHITFYEDIQFDHCLEQQDLIIGLPGDIRCHATARPPPLVRWGKDMMTIKSDRYSFSQDGIHITNVTEMDKGLYLVEAFVAVTGNNKYRSIAVNVLTPPKIKPPIETYKVIQGDEYNLLCQAEGSPPFQYQWLDPCLRDLGKQEGFRVEEGKLTIFKVERNSGGEYKCVVQNGAGTSTAVFKLAVLVTGMPVFEKSFEDVKVEAGSNAEILCYAEGDPTPAYTWYTPKGKEINDSSDTIYAKTSDIGSTLFIINVAHAHAGLYTCGAANRHGLSTKIFELIVEASTRNITEIDTINVVQVTEDSVLFEIVLVDSTTAQWDIQVRYNETYDKEYSYVTLKKGDRLEVKDLITGGRYDFSFRISEDFPWSDPIEVSLFAAVPQVIFRSLTEGKLMIQIYRMLGERSRTTIDKYRVSHNAIKIEKGNSWIVDGNVTSQEVFINDFGRVEITDLEHNTYYEIRVEAHTDAGYGKPYRHIIFTAKDVGCAAC